MSGNSVNINKDCVASIDKLEYNRPFPSSKKSRFQNEAKCETFFVKMSFICIIIKNHFISMASHLASL